jgi:hypothetical protein
VPKNKGPLKSAQQIRNEDNQQDCPQTYAGAAAIAPPAMPVITAATAKNQDQQNDHNDRHLIALSLCARFLWQRCESGMSCTSPIHLLTTN